MASANCDPHLGSGPSEDSEILLDDSDSGSLLSDDSVLPDYEKIDKHREPAKTLYEACSRNEPSSLHRILERGITKDEAMETDINGRVRQISVFISSRKLKWHKLINLFCNKNGESKFNKGYECLYLFVY